MAHFPRLARYEGTIFYPEAVQELPGYPPGDSSSDHEHEGGTPVSAPTSSADQGPEVFPSVSRAWTEAERAALQAIVAEEVIRDAAAFADKQAKWRKQQHEYEPPLWKRQQQHERRPIYGPHQVGRSKSCHSDEDYVQTLRRQENYAMAHNDEDCVQTRRFV